MLATARKPALISYATLPTLSIQPLSTLDQAHRATNSTMPTDAARERETAEAEDVEVRIACTAERRLNTESTSTARTP